MKNKNFLFVCLLSIFGLAKPLRSAEGSLILDCQYVGNSKHYLTFELDVRHGFQVGWVQLNTKTIREDILEFAKLNGFSTIEVIVALRPEKLPCFGEVEKGGEFYFDGTYGSNRAHIYGFSVKGSFNESTLWGTFSYTPITGSPNGAMIKTLRCMKRP